MSIFVLLFHQSAEEVILWSRTQVENLMTAIVMKVGHKFWLDNITTDIQLKLNLDENGQRAAFCN